MPWRGLLAAGRMVVPHWNSTELPSYREWVAVISLPSRNGSLAQKKSYILIRLVGTRFHSHLIWMEFSQNLDSLNLQVSIKLQSRERDQIQAIGRDPQWQLNGFYIKVHVGSLMEKYALGKIRNFNNAALWVKPAYTLMIMLRFEKGPLQG